MNYRHAYHAGNFADCFKHALLVALVDAIGRKSAPYFVLDTHAGAGRYDLDADAALRTAEADMGIRRLLASPSPPLNRYLELVQQLGLYPGSPTLIQAMLRQNDRLACCELHPEDAKTLQRQFRGDPRVGVHHRSGWEALGALLPPKEKRGLVFMDPSFEAQDEFLTLTEGLGRAHARFAQGVLAAWYPIKAMAKVRNFYAGLASYGIADIIATELHLCAPTNPDRFSGCGLLVINPPYQFEQKARLVAEAILNGLGDGETGARAAVVRLANE